MSKTYVSADGIEFNDAMIDRWCEAYERGEFPEGEHTVGGVVMGRPPLSVADKSVTLTIKLPAGMKAAIQRKAAQEGVTVSTYARDVLSNSVLAAS